MRLLGTIFKLIFFYEEILYTKKYKKQTSE